MPRAMRPLLAAATLLVLRAPAAFATNGYFVHGCGTQYKALAGAGAALSLSTLGAATNPAAMAFLGTQLDLGCALFDPVRDYSVAGTPSGAPGTFGLAPGKVESGSADLAIPHLGVNWQLGASTTLGLSLYGNGAMNSDYSQATFGAGDTGVDLTQMFLAPTCTYKLAEGHAVGITPILAYQRFEARGVGSFAGFSSDPAHLSDNGVSASYGGGIRFGYLGQFSPYLAVGAALQTRVWMTAFDEYRGLFAGQGAFDIPTNFVAGIALKPFPAMDIAADVQQVRYAHVKSVGNPLLPNLQQALLGDDSGAGFGWKNMNIYKLGVQLRTAGRFIWRAGYSYGEQPIPPAEVLFNILLPGVIEQHATFGFSKLFGRGAELSFALMRAFSNELTGPNALEAPGQQSITLRMDAWEYELGLGYCFGK
jgi:long-chain fatty acid transport protein